MDGSQGAGPEEPGAERSALEQLFEGDADPARPRPETPPAPPPTSEVSDA